MRAWLRSHLKDTKAVVALRMLRNVVQEYQRQTSWRAAREKAILEREQLIRSYIESHEIPKLHLGCGPYILEDWLNTDAHCNSNGVAYVDVTESFPFEDGTFNYVFSEHLVEHLSYNQGRFMLGECYRVLKPGGRLRITTPDLMRLVSLCSRYKSKTKRAYVKYAIDRFLPDIGTYSECFVVNNFFRCWGHQFIYDSITLQRAMEKEGFTRITRYEAGQSDNENLRGIDSHGKAYGAIGLAMNRYETMIFEGCRPV